MAQAGNTVPLADVIAEANSGVVDNYVTVATFALILYDYVITFGAEVELFWKKKVSRASVLFFLNRYLVLAYQLFEFRGQWIFSDLSSCSFYFNGTRAIIILCYIPWGAFSALRVLAMTKAHKPLTRRNKALAAVVFLLSMAPVVVNFAIFPRLTMADYSYWGDCAEVDNLSAALAVKLAVISRVPLITADIVVIAVTWSALATRRTARPRLLGQKQTTLTDVMLENGLVYVVVMVTLNVLHLAFTISSVLVTADYVSEMTQFTEPLTAILVWRFMLDLHEGANGDIIMDSKLDAMVEGDLSATSNLQFDRPAGASGGSSS